MAAGPRSNRPCAKLYTPSVNARQSLAVSRISGRNPAAAVDATRIVMMRFIMPDVNAGVLSLSYSATTSARCSSASLQLLCIAAAAAVSGC